MSIANAWKVPVWDFVRQGTGSLMDDPLVDQSTKERSFLQGKSLWSGAKPGTVPRRGRCLLMKKPLAPHPEAPPGLTPALERNIQALVERQRREQSEASIQQKVADAITAFTGSMTFVYLHLTIFGVWIGANLHWIPGLPAWDESFVVLAMVASVEAIFLSTFVLISQNRLAADADKRAELDVQISLLTEHEITTMVGLLKEMAAKLNIDTGKRSELQEAASDIAPERVLDKIEETKSRSPAYR